MMIRTMLLVLALAASPLASAQLFRAYLSFHGNDANACTLQAPCRLLPAALAAAANGGEVWMLDSANYNTGPVSVTKSVSILAVPGVIGSLVTAPSGPALLVGAPGLEVSLRNLTIGQIAGSAGPAEGIVLSANSELVIADSVVQGVLSGGLKVSAGTARILNSTFRGSPNTAIHVEGSSVVTVHGSRFVNNGMGLNVTSAAAATAAVTVSDSIIAGNGVGLRAQASSNANALARIRVIRTTIDHNPIAIISTTGGQGAAAVSLTASMLTNNAQPWQIGAGGTIQSTGDNVFLDNGAAVGTPTPLATQ